MSDLKQWQGFTFFHQQDSEGLADEPGTLYLADGAFGDREDAATAPIGERITQTCRENGLSVEWDGRADTRVALVDLRWRKPLPDTN